MRSIIFLTTILFIGCSNDVYEYHGKKYKIYTQADLGKQGNFEAVDLSNSRDSIPSIVFKQPELVLLDLNNKI